MTTFNLPLERVDAERLASLITNAVREGRQLEYKEALPGNTDEDKREFLADVSSFANAIGGDLIYGVRERRDADGRLIGEPESVVGLPGVNLEADRLRLESLIRDGIDPRLSGVTFTIIPRAPDPPCLLIRVPRSWVGLHMVTYKNLSRFYSRSAAGKYQLDVAEIRAGFLAVEATRERILRFRAERIARIMAGETPVLIADTPKLIFHAIPFNPNNAWGRFREIPSGDIVPHLRPIAGSPGAWHFNLDGFLVHTHRRDPSRNCYVQLFRDCAIEAVSVGVIDIYEPHGGYGAGFSGHYMESQVIEGVRNFRNAWRILDVNPPLAICLAITGVRGLRIFPASDRYSLPPATFDRDVLIIPEVVVHDLSAPADLILRPLFDLVWNAGGWAESPHYRDNRWTDQR